MENAQIQKFKCDIFSNFQTLCNAQKAQNHQLLGFKSAIYGKWISQCNDFLHQNEYARMQNPVRRMRTTQFSLDFESMHFQDQRSEKLG